MKRRALLILLALLAGDALCHAFISFLERQRMTRSSSLRAAQPLEGEVASGRPPVGVTFVDAAAGAGVLQMNVSGSAEKKYILESTGAGAAFLDYDLDGDMDLYIVNGATLQTMGAANPSRDALYRNDGAGRFSEVGAEAGVADPGWGGGCAVGDYDNDGDPDLYITNYGANVLYRNMGNGRFSDVTTAAGVGDARWSLGAAWVDIDRDGDLDLYVANYLRFSIDDPAVRSSGCRWKGTPVMCGPSGFQGEVDTLYRNNGDGSFTDFSAEAGIAAKALYGMGVVAGDVDGDADADLFVANDSQDNHLFINDGRGRFEDRALYAGVALSGDGRAQASMGVDLGDYDNDGDEDLLVTNFSDDYHTLYRNDGGGFFTDVSAAAGLDGAARSSVGWGTGFFDYDNDGDLDLFIATGHVYPQVDGNDPATGYRQQNLLFRNESNGRFADVTGQSGPGLLQLRSSRGIAFGDHDDDGDLDLVVVNENDTPSLLRNEGGNALHWVKIRLQGTKSNRDGIGSRLQLRAGGRVQFRESRLNAGYCSSHDPRLHFGLGDAARVERLVVSWPSGNTQVFSDLPADRLVIIEEERGVVEVAVLGKGRRTREPAAPIPAPGPQPVSLPPGGGRGGPPRAVGARLSGPELREVDSLVQQGTRRIKAGQYLEGIKDYEQALLLLPPWEAARKSPDALGFGDAERYRVFLASLYDNLGVGLMRAERLEECAAAIVQGIALLPERAMFHHNLGLCHFHGRRYAEAVEALQAARTAGEGDAVLLYDLGRALASAGRCQEAGVELSLAIEGLPLHDPLGRRAECWYHLGDCCADGGRQEEAAIAFREVLALSPGHQKALYRLGLTFRRMGKAAAADRVQALFRARQPADETARFTKRAGVRTLAERLRLARLFLDAGLPSPASIELELTLNARPADPATLILLGEVNLALRPPALDRALGAFRGALGGEASSAEALVGLGEVYRLQGRADLARQKFQEALQAVPGSIGAVVGLARLDFVSGRTREAVESLRGILERSPGEAAALWALAEIYVSDGAGQFRLPAEALRLLERAGGLYGEGIESRVRALLLLGREREARELVNESPFLGKAERVRFEGILAAE